MGLPGDAFQVKSQRNYFFFIKIEKEKKKQNLPISVFFSSYVLRIQGQV